MRCKKHIADLTSSIGVCASCLRERLEAILAAQAQAQDQQSRVVPRAAAVVASSSDHNQHKKTEENPPPPPLSVPNSVSPYVSRRKSDFAGKNSLDRRLDRLFYSTPQVGPGCDGGRTASSKRRLGKFWNIVSLFRTRSNKPETPSQESCVPSSSAAATASPACLSTILHNRRHNHDDNNGETTIRQSDRETEEFSNESEGNDRSTSVESGISSEPSPLRRNPTAATATATAARRSRFGPAGRSVTKLAFCLSPLVRASPNRQWSHKGLAQELGAPVSGTHQHISTAASFCANRSRKLADFGRCGNHNR